MSNNSRSSASERKLRPIYDHLDMGNFKRALQDIDKLMKKSTEIQYLKVLKSLTLIKMTRMEEAETLLNAVKSETPTDDSTLQTMALCYKDLGQHHNIISIYENAVKQEPTNEKAAYMLFMAYIRLEDYNKQKMLALNLNKTWPKTDYYFWAIMCTYLSATNSNDATLAMKVTLPLGERMCQNMVNQNKLTLSSEILLYLMILEKQNKFAEMVQLLESPLGSRLLPDHLGFDLYRKSKWLQEIKRYKDASDCLYRLLDERSDQFDYYYEAFLVACRLDDPQHGQQDSVNGEDGTKLKHTRLLLSRIDSTIEKFTFLRGPFMAKIAIYATICCNFADKRNILSEEFTILSREDVLVELLAAYFQQFSTKFVCIKDLVFMLQNMKFTPEQSDKLLERVSTFVSGIDPPSQASEGMRVLIFHYLRHYLTTNFEPIGTRFEAAHKLLKLYDVFKSVEARNFMDLTPFDPIIALIIIKLFAGIDTKKLQSEIGEKYMFQAITMLEWARGHSPSDPHIKLMLIRLYGLVGAARACHRLYDKLDLKLIQFDTLGHCFLPTYLALGAHSHAQQFVDHSWRFYSSSIKDVYENIGLGYKNNAYPQIVDIIEFNQKLKNSSQFYGAFVEKNLLEVTKFNDASSWMVMLNVWENMMRHTMQVPWDDLIDTRDLSLLDSYNRQTHEDNFSNNSSLIDCYDRHTHKDVKRAIVMKTFVDDVLWLRYRYALFHSLLSTAQCAHKSSNANPELAIQSDFDSLADHLSRLEQLADVCNKTALKDNDVYPLEGPAPSRMNHYFVGGTARSVVLCLKAVYHFMLYHNSGHPFPDQFHAQLAEVDFAQRMKQLEDLNYEQSTLLLMAQVLKGLADLLEIISQDILALDIASTLFGKFKKSKSKKKNAESQTNEAQMAKFVGFFSQLKKKLAECVQRMIRFVEARDAFFATPVSEDAQDDLCEAKQFFTWTFSEDSTFNLPGNEDRQFNSQARTEILESYQSSLIWLRRQLLAKTDCLSRINLPNAN